MKFTKSGTVAGWNTPAKWEQVTTASEYEELEGKANFEVISADDNLNPYFDWDEKAPCVSEMEALTKTRARADELKAWLGEHSALKGHSITFGVSQRTKWGDEGKISIHIVVNGVKMTPRDMRNIARDSPWEKGLLDENPYPINDGK